MYLYHLISAEAAEVLFDHGHSEVYTATREQVEGQVEAERAPPPAPPSAAAAAEAAREFGSVWPVSAAPAANGTAAAAAAAVSHRLFHRMPPPAAPAAAAEPVVAPHMPPVPAGLPTGTTGHVGSGDDSAAAQGLAAELVADVLQETAASELPPKVRCRSEDYWQQRLLAAGLIGSGARWQQG